MPVIVESLSHTFRPTGRDPVHALEAIDLKVEDGSIIALLGPSGCGKTTLLNAMAGLVTPDEGRVSITMPSSSAGGERDREVAYIFQSPRLLPWRTVYANIVFALASLDIPHEEREERVWTYLDLVQLNGYSDLYPGELSGGMQQRVAIARAFATHPQALLMDEPFSALDEITAETMRHEFAEIARKRRQTVVLVTHNVREAVQLADHVVVMSPSPGRVSGIVDIQIEEDLDQANEQLWRCEALVRDVMNRSE